MLLPGILLAVLVMTAVGVGTVSALTWQKEDVDVGADPSLALDGAGNPRISYTTTNSHDLKYAAWTGSGWQKQIVSPGWDSSLALDSGGSPRIIFIGNAAAGTDAVMRYAAWTGTNWQITDAVSYPPDMAWHGLYSPSLKLDGAGRPHICYIYMEIREDTDSMELYYATWDGSAWQRQKVMEVQIDMLDASLALDSSGNPRISSNTGFGLKYAEWNGLAWQTQTVDAGVLEGAGSSLALDGLGKPRISYYDRVNDALKYAAWTGTAWTFQTVDSGLGLGWMNEGPSLCFDRTGRPRISYQSNGNLKYAAWTGSVWETETVDTPVSGSSGKSTGYASCLALDSAGNPRIAYYDSSSETVRYARAISSPTVTGISPSGGWQGSTVAITNLGGTNFAAGATVKLTKPSYNDIVATDVTVVSPTQITCSFPLAASTATGAWNVVVTSGGTSVTLPAAFTVTDERAVATAVDATGLTWSSSTTNAQWLVDSSVTHDGVDAARSGRIGNSAISVLSTTVTGPATVSFWWKVSCEDAWDSLWLNVDGETLMTITGETDWNQRSVDLAAGTHTLIWNYRKDSATSAGSDAGWVDQVTIARPSTISGITPTAGARGTTISVTVSGTTFASASEVAIQNQAAPGEIVYATGESVNTAGTAITCTLALPGTLTPGTYALRVRDTPTSDWIAKTDAFTVLDTVTVSGIMPTSADAGQTISATVSGTGFSPDAQVYLICRLGSIAATDESTNSAHTAITCTFAIPSTAAISPYSIAISHPGTNLWAGTKADAFNVTVNGITPPFTVTGITPASANAGDTISATVSGTGFNNGFLIPRIRLVGGGTIINRDDRGDDASTNNAGTEITCTFAIPSTAYIGSYAVEVQNTRTWAWTSQGGAFTVLPPGSTVVAVPPATALPTDQDGDGLYEDVNGNSRPDFADVVLYFNQMIWISANEPLSAFDYNNNTRIDFADVVWLFNHL